MLADREGSDTLPKKDKLQKQDIFLGMAAVFYATIKRFLLKTLRL